MAISDAELKEAEVQTASVREGGYAVSARYDRKAERIVVELNTGVQVAIPVRLIEGLQSAQTTDLASIEITPAGLGLHWPRLDADIYVPALLQGILGSKRWMAMQLGASGGASRSAAKTFAARNNGRKGGRPPKVAAR